MPGDSAPKSRNDLILDLFKERASVEDISRAVHAHFGNYVGASEINAVVHRAKQRKDPRAFRPRTKKGRGQTTFNNAPFGKPGTRKPPRLPALPQNDGPLFTWSLTSILDVKSRQCRYPLAHDGRQLFVCGAPTVGPLSYCQHHAKICYQPKS